MLNPEILKLRKVSNILVFKQNSQPVNRSRSNFYKIVEYLPSWLPSIFLLFKNNLLGTEDQGCFCSEEGSVQRQQQTSYRRDPGNNWCPNCQRDGRSLPSRGATVVLFQQGQYEIQPNWTLLDGKAARTSWRNSRDIQGQGTLRLILQARIKQEEITLIYFGFTTQVWCMKGTRPAPIKVNVYFDRAEISIKRNEIRIKGRGIDIR